jgi:DNA-binding winged helix-turn-helix (wHTH) protein
VFSIRFDFRALTASGPTPAAGLTPRDILVLRVLVARRGEVVSRLDIIEEVCGLDSEATLRTVDNHIVALRRAVGDDPKRPRFIQTVRGEGYGLVSRPDPDDTRLRGAPSSFRREEDGDEENRRDLILVCCRVAALGSTPPR